VDLTNADLGAMARDVLARRGINPADVPPEPAFSLADHLTEQANATLDLIMPPRYRRASADNPAVLAWMRRYVEDPTDAPVLVIKGPVGTGKTHQALGALRQIVLASARRCRRMTYAVTSHPTFNDAMFPHKDDRHRQALRDFQTVDLLVFDDIGAGRSTEWTEDTLYRLFDARWANQLATIATTNFDGKEMKQFIDERVVSRLADGEQVPLVGSDRRRGEVTR